VGARRTDLGRAGAPRGPASRGYLPELFRYPGWLTAREVLATHCELAGLDRTAWAREITDSLRTVGLAERADDRVQTYSKGMQQRLGLGVALIGGPEVMFLDEPTSALDPVGRHDVREIVRGLRARGATVFLNSHLLTEVEQVCDRVAVVDRGRVIATGTLDDLLRADTVHLRVTGLTGEARADLARSGFTLDGDGDRLIARGVSADRVPALVDALVRAGARLYEVTPAHESLEERFLALLKDS
jgi:ABC-2 type transport system ATP-binding protein